MNILSEFPPNYAAIIDKFGRRSIQGAVFTYGDTIYCPGHDIHTISTDLQAHEEIHCQQQGARPDVWWDRYLEDPEFRLAQELEAYRFQWGVLQASSRAHKRWVLKKIAKDLSGPMYGKLITKDKALQLITEPTKK